MKTCFANCKRERSNSKWEIPDFGGAFGWRGEITGAVRFKADSYCAVSWEGVHVTKI